MSNPRAGDQPDDRREHLIPRRRVERERDLRLDVAVGHAHVVAVAERLVGEIALALAQERLGARELELAALADAVPNEVLEAIEDPRREDLHSEEAEVLAAPEPGRPEVLVGVLRRRLLPDR